MSATHKDDLNDVGGFNTRIDQSLLTRFDGMLDERDRARFWVCVDGRKKCA